MSERLEIDIIQSITVNDQTKGTEAKPSSPQTPSTPVQSSETSPQVQAAPPAPEAVKTAEAKAVSAESVEKKPDFLSRAVKKIRELEESGEPLPKWLEGVKKRYMGEAVPTEEAEAKKSEKKKKTPDIQFEKPKESTSSEPPEAVQPPEAVKPPKPPGPEVVSTPGEPPIAAPVGEAVGAGAEAAATGAIETGVQTAAVAGAEAAGTGIGEVAGASGAAAGAAAGAAGGAGGGAITGAAIGTAAAPGPGTVAGAAIGALAGISAGQLLGEAFSELVETVQAVDKALMQMSKDAAQYNAQVAQAQATAELRDMVSQMQRAERLGPQLAEFTDVRSQLAVDFQDAITEVAGPITEIFTGILEIGRDIMDIIIPLAEASNSFYEWIKDALGQLPDAVKAFIAWFGVDKRDRDEKRAKETEDVLKQIDDFLNPVLLARQFMDEDSDKPAVKSDFAPRVKGF